MARPSALAPPIQEVDLASHPTGSAHPRMDTKKFPAVLLPGTEGQGRQTLMGLYTCSAERPIELLAVRRLRGAAQIICAGRPVDDRHLRAGELIAHEVGIPLAVLCEEQRRPPTALRPLGRCHCRSVAPSAAAPHAPPAWPPYSGRMPAYVAVFGQRPPRHAFDALVFVRPRFRDAFLPFLSLARYSRTDATPPVLASFRRG